MHDPACELRRTRIRRSSQNPIYANFVELRLGEVRRITLPRTPVNNALGVWSEDSSPVHQPRYTSGNAASENAKVREMADSKRRPEERNAQRGRAVVNVLVFAGGLALYLLLGLGLWWALNQYIDPQNSAQKRDVVQTLGLLMAAVAAGVGIFFTWQGQRITQESLQDTRENSEENLRLAREGQTTERFTRAIDQLGATD
jgi:uncharacterized protein HemX